MSEPRNGPTLEGLLNLQRCVFRPSQVAPWLTVDEIRAEVKRGTWQMPHRNVYVAHNGPLSYEQELWVCQLCAPPGSAIGGLAAAELDGLQGFHSDSIDLVAAAKQRLPRRPGLVPHFSHHLGHEDVHPLRLPRRTRLPRSVLDAASWALHERRARAIVLASVQQRLTRPQDLLAHLERRGRLRRRALIVESIEDARGGIASVPERDFDLIRRRRRLPEPSRQHIVRRRDGKYYLDADWAEFGFAAEVHGVQHSEFLNWDDDLDRLSVVAARGRRVLQFSSYSVRHRQAWVGELLEEALRNGGWQPR